MSKCDSCSLSGTCDTNEYNDARLPPGMLSVYDIDKDTADGILVWLEIKENITKTSLAALSEARKLNKGRVFGMIFGDGDLRRVYNEAFECGADTIYHVRSAKLDSFDADDYAHYFTDMVNRIRPMMILIPLSADGNALGDKLSISFNRKFIIFNERSEAPFPVLAYVKENMYEPTFEEGRTGTAINITPSNR